MDPDMEMQIPAQQPRPAGIAGLIAAFFFAIAKGIKDVLGGSIMYVLKEVLGILVDTIKDLLGPIVNSLKEILGSIVDGLKEILGSLFDGLKNLLGGLITEFLASLFTGLKEVLGLLGGTILDVLGSLIKDALGGCIINILSLPYSKLLSLASQLIPLSSSSSNRIDLVKKLLTSTISYRKVGFVVLMVTLGMTFFGIFRAINHFLGPV